MRSPLFDIYDPDGTLEEQARLGLLMDEEDEFGIRRPKKRATISDLMPEEEKQSLLRSAANMGASGVSGLGWLLDTPGAVIRGLASGGPAKAISALWESSGDRVEGRELLRQYGLVGDQDNWQNWAAGFAGEVLLDPLTYMNPLAVLGRGALGKGARAADRAGLLENIDLIAKAEGKGTRELMRDMTVGQLVSNPQTGKDAFDRLALAARGKGLDVDDIMKERLAGLAEIRLPGTERGMLLSGGKVGDTIARGLDDFGELLQTNKYTAPIANRAVAAFDPNVLDQIDPEKQWMAREAVAGTRNRQRARLEDLTTQTLTARKASPAGVPDDLARFDSRRIQNAIADSIEAGLDPKRMSLLADQEALAVIDSVPEWAEFRRWTEDTLASEMQARAALGLDTPIAKSLEGTSFLPSQVVRFSREQPVNIPGRDGRRMSAYERGQKVFATDDLVGRGRQDYLDLDRRRETLRRLMSNQPGSAATGRALQDRLIAAGDAELPGIMDEAFAALGLASPYSQLRTADGATMQSLRDALIDPNVVNRTELAKQLADLEKTAAAQKVQLGDLIRQSDMQFASEGMGLFDNDVVTDLQRYLGGGARAQANADLLGRVLQSKASTVPFDQVPGGGAVNLLKGAESLGFDKSRLQPMLEARMPGADVAGLSITQKELDALKVLAPSVPKPEGPGTRAWNTYTSAFKIGALANPAYHVRNAYSGLTSTLTGGGVSPVGAILDAYAGFQAGRGNYGPAANRLAQAPRYRHFSSKQDIIDDFLIQSGRNDLGQGLVRESDAVSGSPALTPGGGTQPSIKFYDPNRSWEDWATVRGVDWSDILTGTRSAPRETLNPLLQAHEFAGKSVEDGLRLGTYIGQIRQGASPDRAAQQVFKTQVNYAPEAYTNFERQLKKYVPFYSYSRGIAPLVAENLLQRPGGVQGQIIRGMSNLSRPGEDRFVPEHLRSSAAVALPGEYGEEGNLQRYLTNIDVPFEGLVNLISPGVGNTVVEQISDGVQKTAMNLAGMVNPIYKAPLEMLFNRQLYSGREMSDLYSMLEQDIGPLGRPLEQIAVNLPMGSKINALVRTARDERLSPGARAAKLAINNLLGVKVTDVDEKRAGEQAARKTLTDLLSSTPGVRTYENVTVPEDVLREMPEEQRKRYLVYKVLQAEASKRARQRKAADPMDILLNR
jgi:hypothetical protein